MKKMSGAGCSFRSMKREEYLDWEDYFMAVAFLAAKRSKDPCTQVGACIVNDDNKIIGIGYNGFPRGCSDDKYPWSKGSYNPLENKYFYVCHAELNAILNKNTSDAKGCRMYVALFPCNECAKVIIQSGIKEVIYMSKRNCEKDEVIAATKMFSDAGVSCRAFVPKEKVIIINFDDINRKCKSPWIYSLSEEKKTNNGNSEHNDESLEKEAAQQSDDSTHDNDTEN